MRSRSYVRIPQGSQKIMFLASNTVGCKSMSLSFEAYEKLRPCIKAGCYPPHPSAEGATLEIVLGVSGRWLHNCVLRIRSIIVDNAILSSQ